MTGSDTTSSSSPDPRENSERRYEREDEIVMVPVPRSRLQDVYAVLGRSTGSESPQWETVTLSTLRGSMWMAREIVAPAARRLSRQDLSEVGQVVADAVGRSARAVLDSLDE